MRRKSVCILPALTKKLELDRQHFIHNFRRELTTQRFRKYSYNEFSRDHSLFNGLLVNQNQLLYQKKSAAVRESKIEQNRCITNRKIEAKILHAPLGVKKVWSG